MKTLLQILFATLLCARLATAAVGQPYEPARFDALQREGRAVLVWFHADWCPTCRAQERILDELLVLPELRELTVLRVDYDAQKPVVRAFRALRQGTFVLFRGGKEMRRSLGGTDRDDILEFLRPMH